ncbi:hypothetical protein J2Y45_006208 [Dyadobacter sp. BE34]|uniref:EF-hand domain-containing protein n=1 Tax=Dyadobacter fermentans TaxID=94254 RepID=A0ABU1R6F6_9BACT|nr:MULTISPECIES: hypothetical protein [Dyadobacter]MDR6808994.1 hypothetical protein [Dyadobacter fermentans]MDR7046737.1 hypothetical protein [Dyadobacter sp. BE242]MDR7201051.1 hypothetical protein [Dyadobacter sp. BE34]MDR7219011.1 hypothetical protein [Dyadobacter sp. BE31]MDR7264779.1 hypothetical protein [Dyadobacter sp. BE32]
MENEEIENQELEDQLLLEITQERDKGDTISYDEFCKAMGWNNQDS